MLFLLGDASLITPFVKKTEFAVKVVNGEPIVAVFMRVVRLGQVADARS